MLKKNIKSVLAILVSRRNAGDDAGFLRLYLTADYIFPAATNL